MDIIPEANFGIEICKNGTPARNAIFLATEIYRESSDFNLLIEHGKEERLAANRCVICIMTEFGISNDRRMSSPEFSKFIWTTQAVGMVTE